MARTQQLLQTRFSQNARNTIRVKPARITRNTGFSGQEVLSGEPSRVASYIQLEYLNAIVDMASSREAVDSLTTDNVKGELGNQDFENLLGNVFEEDKEAFARWLFDKYGRPKLRIIRERKITLKSGRMRRGLRLNQEVYLIRIRTKTGKSYVQARSFKTGRVTGLPRELLKRIK